MYLASTNNLFYETKYVTKNKARRFHIKDLLKSYSSFTVPPVRDCFGNHGNMSGYVACLWLYVVIRVVIPRSNVFMVKCCVEKLLLLGGLSSFKSPYPP